MSIGRLTRDGLPFSNVVATGVATSQITPGRTLENYQLKLGGTFTKAMISLVKMKANGKTIFEGSGSQIDKLNAFRGDHTDAAFLDIQFSDLTGYNEFDRHVGALDTSRGIVSLTSEVTIAGATSPTLKGILHEAAAQADLSGAPAAFAGVMTKVLRYPFSVATGGKLPVNLPFGPVNGALIKRIHIEAANDLCTGVTVKQDGLVLHESLAAENDYELQRWGRVPQALWYSLDFVKDGVMTKGLDTRDARSLELVPEFSGADSGYVIVEYLDVLGNL